MIWLAVALPGCAPTPKAEPVNPMAGEARPVARNSDVLTPSQFLEKLQSSFDAKAGKLDFAAIKQHFGAQFKPPFIAQENALTQPWVDIKTAPALTVSGIEAITLKQSIISIPTDAARIAGNTATTRRVIEQDMEMRLKSNQLCITTEAVQAAFQMQVQSGIYKRGGISRLSSPVWSHGAPDSLQTLQKSRAMGLGSL